MTKNERPSVDGFIPRRRPVRGDSTQDALRPSPENSGLSHASEKDDLKRSSLKHEHVGGLTRAQVDESLRSIEEDSKKDKKRRKKHINKRRLIKRLSIGVIVIAIVVGIAVLAKFLIAGSNIFKGDFLGYVQSKPLRADKDGFSNMLIFGTSEDDEGHEGAYLTDSLLVLSVNQEKNIAYTYSIPRDLWVDYDKACLGGYEGRINEVFQCHSDFGKHEEVGSAKLSSTVSEVIGREVHYYAHVNYSVVREVVKAVDGITIDIEGSNGAPGIMDNNFDWKCKGGNQYASLETMKQNCPPNGHFIEYPNGPAKLDAEHALYLAMARGAGSQSYGLSRSNFDREINQQKIAVALKEKALSVGTLTNLSKVTALIDALGNNLRTNFETGEIRTLMRIGEETSSDNIQSISLVDAEPKLLVFDMVNGASILRSANGFGDYNNVAQYLHKQMSSDPIVRENASIAVYNGSGVAGKAQEVADQLTEKMYSVADVGNAPSGKYTKYELYAVGDEDKPATKAKLEELYGVTTNTTESPVATVGVDFVLIVGAQG